MIKKITFLLLAIGPLPQKSHTMRQPAPNQATSDLVALIKSFQQLPKITLEKAKLPPEDLTSVRNYLAKGAQVNANIGEKQYTILHYAILHEITDPEFYTIVLNAGANPLIKDYKDRTARMFLQYYYKNDINQLKTSIEKLKKTMIDRPLNEINQKEQKDFAQAIEFSEARLKRLDNLDRILNQAEKKYLLPIAKAIEQSDAQQLPRPIQQTVLAYLFGGEQADYLPEKIDRPEHAQSKTSKHDLALLQHALQALASNQAPQQKSPPAKPKKAGKTVSFNDTPEIRVINEPVGGYQED